MSGNKIRCKLGLHRWSEFGAIVETYGGLTQFRNCLDCNKITYTSTYGNQASADVIKKNLSKNEANK